MYNIIGGEKISDIRFEKLKKGFEHAEIPISKICMDGDVPVIEVPEEWRDYVYKMFQWYHTKGKGRFNWAIVPRYKIVQITILESRPPASRKDYIAEANHLGKRLLEAPDDFELK